MKIAEIAGLVAWLPFLLALSIIGTVSCVKGYKKGVIRASINLGLTFVSAFLALLVAKLISGINFGISGLIENAFSGEGGFIAEMAEDAASAILSLLIFPLIFIILSPIIKAIIGAIIKKKLPTSENKGLKLGGLGVALLDAIVFVMFLTIPVYGTLSLVDKGADTVSVFAEEIAEKDEFVIFQKVGDNLPAKLTNIPPFSTVYDSLMTFEYRGGNLSISKTIRLGSSIVADISEMKDKEPADYSENEINLITKAESLIVKNHVFCTVISEIASSALEDVDGLEEYAKTMTPESVSEDLGALCDVVRSAIKNEVIAEIVENKEDLSKVFSSGSLTEGEFIYDLTEAINETNGMRTLKKSLFTLVSKSVGEEKRAQVLGTNFEKAAGMLLSEDEIKAEGDSFVLIIRGVGKLAALETSSDENKEEGEILAIADFIEGFARHPAIKVDGAIDSISAMLEGEDGKIILFGNEKVKADIKNILSDAVSKPVGSDQFGKFLLCLLNTTKAFDVESLKNGDTAAMEKLLNSDAETLKDVSELISTELVSELGVSKEIGETVVLLADNILNTIAELKESGVDTKKEAESLTSFVSAVSDAKNVSKKEASNMLKDALESEIISSAVVSLAENDAGSQEAVSDNLAKSVKTEISNVLKDYYNSNKTEENLEKVNAYAEFFGLKKIA